VETLTITKAGATFEVTRDERFDAFWEYYESDSWEPEAAAAFARYLKPGTRYVDLGAWIGPTVLLAASIVDRVVCAEPDPVAFAILTANIGLNPFVAAKTTALRAAAGARDGTVTLSSAGPGGDSNSSAVRAGDDGSRWSVEQVSVASLLQRAGLEAADFVKIDIEGSEYELLRTFPGKPTLFVAMHPNLLVDKRSTSARVSTSIHALRANRRLLRAMLRYRYHYVFDESSRSFRNVKGWNLVRAFVPVPLRASLLIGACVFTDERV
jgi:FkbM family methyltransferase